MNQTANKTSSKEMVKDHKTGGFIIALTKADKELMAKKKIIAMCGDFSGHFCIYRNTKAGKNVEQKERFSTPREAIAAVK